MTGDIDSVEVFDETKARAFSKNDENTISVLKDLHTLYQLRVRLSSFQLPRYFNCEEVRRLHVERLILKLISHGSVPTHTPR